MRAGAKHIARRSITRRGKISKEKEMSVRLASRYWDIRLCGFFYDGQLEVRRLRRQWRVCCNVIMCIEVATNDSNKEMEFSKNIGLNVFIYRCVDK